MNTHIISCDYFSITSWILLWTIHLKPKQRAVQILLALDINAHVIGNENKMLCGKVLPMSSLISGSNSPISKATEHADFNSRNATSSHVNFRKRSKCKSRIITLNSFEI